MSLLNIDNLKLTQNIVVVLLLLGSMQGYSQNLIRGYSACEYLEEPVYIINDGYVVYQDCRSRKIINPDTETFHIPAYAKESGIAMDKNGIYFQGQLLKIDTTGFKLVGEYRESMGSDTKYPSHKWIWKTKDKVFSNTQEIEGADAETFEVVGCFNGGYFYDKHGVYYVDKKIEGSDGLSVAKGCENVVYDKNQVYINGEIATYKNEKLRPVNHILAKTKTEVVIIDNGNITPLPKMDVQSTEGLSRKYFKDKNGVYFSKNKLPIELENLDRVKVWDQVNSAYASDGINIYYMNGVLQSNLDAGTFGMLPHSDFVYDKDGVYKRKWDGEKEIIIYKKFPFDYTEAVTPENLSITERSRYIIYNDQVYDPWDKKLFKNLTQEQWKLIKADAILNPGEGNNIEAKPIGHGIFLLGNKIVRKGADGTWVTLREIDLSSFSQINALIAKDKNGVYHLWEDIKVLKNIDPETATASFYPFVTDKNSLFYFEEPLISSKKLELLAAFPGYRLGCGLDESTPTNYYLFRNIEGYYLIETTEPKITVKFLGKTFSPDWDEKLNNFELP